MKRINVTIDRSVLLHFVHFLQKRNDYTLIDLFLILYLGAPCTISRYLDYLIY